MTVSLAAAGGRRWLPVLVTGFACAAYAAPPDDALGWLQRAADAARNASYAGTFVHTNGERMSTIRVTHVKTDGQEHERIEALDGPPYEIVRRDDEMFCYYPDAKTVRLDRRVNARFFPSLFRAPAEVIGQSYDVKLGNVEHVLGYDCRWILLEPRDAKRFPERLCSEVGTGLVVRARTMSLQGQVLEQYTFTDLKLGPHVARGDVKSIFEARVKQWITDARPREEAKGVDTGWTVEKLPAGFEKMTELRRTLPGRPHPVSQLIYSDGLASLSVFVEPNGAPTRTREASSEDGTTTFFARPMGDQLVTVLGEVPLATAEQVAASVAHRP
ncbi:MAG TPA: MucB/RseB C-terminal domain-containing protein [Usitatibacter sp.]|jgi:sigma-E factor negative regulatory protein RseB|nr:MucB/RseB C-terminal domain-containing protein [Usitatibacter sp.]